MEEIAEECEQVIDKLNCDIIASALAEAFGWTLQTANEEDLKALEKNYMTLILTVIQLQ